MVTRGIDPRARREPSQVGFTLIEMMVVIAIIAVAVGLLAPTYNNVTSDMRLKSAARGVADSLHLARAQAIRTGNPHVVYFGSDTAGNALNVPVLVHEAQNGDCQMGGGDPAIQPLEDVQFKQNVAAYGKTLAAAAAPDDPDPLGLFGGGATGQATSFTDVNGVSADWVAFLPTGVPVAMSVNPACQLGALASGRGAVYLTNGRRDYAVVLDAMGSLRVELWDPGSGQWRN